MLNCSTHWTVLILFWRVLSLFPSAHMQSFPISSVPGHQHDRTRTCATDRAWVKMCYARTSRFHALDEQSLQNYIEDSHHNFYQTSYIFLFGKVLTAIELNSCIHRKNPVYVWQLPAATGKPDIRSTSFEKRRSAGDGSTEWSSLVVLVWRDTLWLILLRVCIISKVLLSRI